ncbi:hypothetical protein IMY05_C4449001600 [Salix suchowensis]|nr:hypothetical protein IMY05_C4449001600 [Salix suchowensis]
MGGRAVFVWYDGESCVKDDTESDAETVCVVADESAPLDALDDDLEVESDSVSISLESESTAREDMLGIASRSASMGGQDMVPSSGMGNSSPSSRKLLRGSGRGAKRIFRWGVGGVLALALLFACLDDDDAPEDEEDATEFEEDVVGNGYNDEEYSKMPFVAVAAIEEKGRRLDRQPDNYNKRYMNPPVLVLFHYPRLRIRDKHPNKLALIPSSSVYVGQQITKQLWEEVTALTTYECHCRADDIPIDSLCFPTHIVPSLRMFYAFLSAIYDVLSAIMCVQSVVD